MSFKEMMEEVVDELVTPAKCLDGSIGVCANGACICASDSVNGVCECAKVNNENECQKEQQHRTVLDLRQAVTKPVRGRSITRKGKINRSRSLHNKNLVKKDMLTQPVFTQWSHLFVRRRASSVDSPRVSPRGIVQRRRPHLSLLLHRN